MKTKVPKTKKRLTAKEQRARKEAMEAAALAALADSALRRKLAWLPHPVYPDRAGATLLDWADLRVQRGDHLRVDVYRELVRRKLIPPIEGEEVRIKDGLGDMDAGSSVLTTEATNKLLGLIRAVRVQQMPSEAFGAFVTAIRQGKSVDEAVMFAFREWDL